MTQERVCPACDIGQQRVAPVQVTQMTTPRMYTHMGIHIMQENCKEFNGEYSVNFRMDLLIIGNDL